MSSSAIHCRTVPTGGVTADVRWLLIFGVYFAGVAIFLPSTVSCLRVSSLTSLGAADAAGAAPTVEAGSTCRTGMMRSVAAAPTNRLRLIEYLS
jgi:hypothetical protein